MGERQTVFDRINGADTVGLARTPELLDGRAGELQSRLRPLSELHPVLTSRYLVKGWLDRGAFSVVYGESNVGKTFFALDLAIHIAAGRDWHGAKVAAPGDLPGGVIYVAGEGGTGLNNRIEALRCDKMDLYTEADAHRGFRLLPTLLDLCGKDDAGELLKVMDLQPARPALIVIDTLARNMGEGDENTARDMGAFIQSCDRLREATGAHLMVIHHSGKDVSRGARGSGSLRGAVDTEIHLTRSGIVIMAETKKQRDMPTGKVFAYTLRDVEIGTDEDDEPVTSAVVEPTEPVKKLRRLTGQKSIAMQALDDALAQKGEKRPGDMFPQNRRCVSVETWREYCERHSLSGGKGESAARMAFNRARDGLHSEEFIRIIDEYVWRCEE
jgi:hypothetical protein